MADMELKERHARLRAHEDEKARGLMHDFVVEHFGGDYKRAAWFLDECASIAQLVKDAPTIYSVTRGYLGFHRLT